MAQLDVQPKRKKSVFIWLVFAILAIATGVLLYRGCNRSAPLRIDSTDTIAKDTVKADSNNVIVSTQPDWDAINFNIPKTSFDEVTDSVIIIKANDNYTIYSLGENVLFAAGKSALQPSAVAKLQQIASSLNKRYKTSAIAVYGHTDSVAGNNKMLATDRANTVKSWLQTKGGVLPDKISVHPLSEEKSLATNSTEKDRIQNRSVEIVAYTGGEKN